MVSLGAWLGELWVPCLTSSPREKLEPYGVYWRYVHIACTGGLFDKAVVWFL